jgi:ubiquinone/menaquinone biosynthesis C-methylase UbiE
MTRPHARVYLRTIGAPSEGSKRLLVEVLSGMGTGLSILDLGCGNAQLLAFFRAQGLDCDYTGVDFSAPLLEAAREAFAVDVRAHFLSADANTLEGVSGRWDVALYSHVIEMLSSPEQSLIAARRLASMIVVRFFEPPLFEVDSVELREMEVGEGSPMPYLRRKMGRDYYRMLLAKLGCRSVDVYRDETSEDQIHVLHY